MLDDATMAERLYGTPKPTAPQPPIDEAAAMAERLYGGSKPEVKPPELVNDPAARLFGGPDTEPVASEEREPRTEEEQAAALFGKPEAPEVKIDIPADILAERKADKERVLFSPQETFREAIPDTLLDGTPEAGNMPEPMRRAAVAEVREMVADMGMSADDVKTLRDLGSIFDVAPSQEQVIAWREESVDLLNRTYGNQATQALRDAQAFIAQDPRRVKMFEVNNRGDHPKVVEMCARLGRKARLAGKLKNGKR